MSQSTSIFRLFQCTANRNFSKRLPKRCIHSAGNSPRSKWKTPLAAALLFVVIHVSIVNLFGDEDSLHVPNSPMESIRWRDIRAVDYEPTAQELSSESEDTADHQDDRSRIEEVSDLNNEGDEEKESPLIDRSVCNKGHIQGMRSVCLQQPCLHQLKDFQGYPVKKKSIDVLVQGSSAEKLREKFQISELRFVQGSFDPVNFPLVSLITTVQKHFGVYGSVGLVQTHLDKFSCLLVSTIDREIGEKLIVVHPFNVSNRPFFVKTATDKPIGTPSDKEVYISHLREMGFKDHTHHGDQVSGEFYLFDESMVSIPRDLARHRIPQFRVISISSDPVDPLALLFGLETAVCNLRDGGIIILNFGDGEPYPLNVLKSILGIKFDKALSVLLATPNRIYLTTTNWTSKYLDLILQHSVSLRSGLATFDKSTGYYRTS